MSYQALYRVWRPQRFSELLGQDVITTTLKNAIITNQISHAYLFAGPRGTGKTSAAKIFAKAVNCPNQKGGEPCNKCTICKAITNGTLNDVIEIDAASNNGVEEIRNVRDKAKYAPTEAKYKVYIIDEVHMLSQGAFNALLKTLEEPPKNVIFILATTEPQKILPTVISRTQRFNFKRIKPQVILERMQYILKHDKIDYDDNALAVIAKSAEGGMRDALSILDQVLSYGDDTVTYENSLQVTGSVTKILLHNYFAAIVDKNVKNALLDVKEMFDNGKDVNQFIDDMINYCQDILLYHQSPTMLEKSELGVLDETFKADSKAASDQLIYQIIEQLNDIQYQIHFSNHPDVYLEVLTVKIATLPNDDETTYSNDDSQIIDKLSEQLKSLQKEVDHLRQDQVKNVKISHVDNDNQSKLKDPSDTKNKTAKVNVKPVDKSSVYQVLQKATRQDLSRIKDVWDELIQSMSVENRAMMNVSEPVAASDSGIVVRFEYDFFYQRSVENDTLSTAIENGLSQIIGYAPKVVFASKEQWQRLRTAYIKELRKKQNNSGENSNAAKVDEKRSSEPTSSIASTIRSTADVHVNSSESPIVKRATSLFGKNIVNVKDD